MAVENEAELRRLEEMYMAALKRQVHRVIAWDNELVVDRFGEIM